MSRKKSQRHDSGPPRVALSDADINRLSKAITNAIIEADTKKNAESSTTLTAETRPRISIKDVLCVFFCPLNKLKRKNSASLFLIKTITSSVCGVVSKVGYFCAVVMVSYGVGLLIADFTLENAFVATFLLLLSMVVWLLSRLVAATGIEIEETNNENLIFGISAFILAVISILISLFKRGG